MLWAASFFFFSRTKYYNKTAFNGEVLVLFSLGGLKKQGL